MTATCTVAVAAASPSVGPPAFDRGELRDRTVRDDDPLEHRREDPLALIGAYLGPVVDKRSQPGVLSQEVRLASTVIARLGDAARAL
ncbi:MAG: hypothetical protein M3T56_13630 [Chloroflexota bacterium]|nr:hypothetical protein [Chloroflexota bacterium]